MSIGSLYRNIVGNYHNGNIYLVNIYNRPLTQSEVIDNNDFYKWRFRDHNYDDAPIPPVIPTDNKITDWNAENDVYTDAGVTLATNGQTVQEWLDQVSGITAEQTTTSDKPTYYTTGGLISKPFVDFDGTDDWLEVLASNTLYTDQDITFYVVTEVDTSDQYETHFHRGENWDWETGWVVSMDDASGGMSATVGDWSNNEVTNTGGSAGNGQLNNLEVRSMRFQTSVSSGSRVINIRVSDNSAGIGSDNGVTLTGDDINDAPNKNAVIGASYNGTGTDVQANLDGRIYRLLIYNTYHDNDTYNNTIQALLNEYQ
jgi:hypothetical protein